MNVDYVILYPLIQDPKYVHSASRVDKCASVLRHSDKHVAIVAHETRAEIVTTAFNVRSGKICLEFPISIKSFDKKKNRNK